jgi:LacI family transcriptional regulator
MLRGFTRFARSHRWRLVFIPRTAAAREPRRLRRLVAEFRPAGLFANYTEGLRELAPRLLPTVWFDCATWKIVPRTASVVGADHSRIGELAAEEILRLNPGTYLCVAAKGEPWSENRARPFSAYLSRRGRTCRIVRVDFSFDDPSVSLPDIKRMLGKAKLPCRVFAVCDRLANEVMLAAEQLGLRVPDAVGVIGVDNDETLCLGGAVALTSVQPDFEMGGWLCGEALARRMASPKSRGESLEYGVSGIMRRGSTFAPRRPMDQAAVERAEAFIQTNAVSRIGVKDVVREMGCSRRLGEQRFREATGSTIHERIASVRLDALLVQLRRAHVNIGYLADACGFGSASALRAFFRKRMGVSMTEWRSREIAAQNKR